MVSLMMLPHNRLQQYMAEQLMNYGSANKRKWSWSNVR